MSSHRLRVLFAALLTLSVATLASRPAHAAWPHDPTVNVPVCMAAYSQQNPVAISDGAGGTIVAWADYRSGSDNDIFAQRLDADGVPQWAVDGVGLSKQVYHQESPVIVSDGAGGAIVAWKDNRSGYQYDVYAQRVDAAGIPQWTAHGVAICTNTQEQRNVAIASDGSGGAIITWEDARGTWDIYAQRVDASGIPQWTTDGVAVCTELYQQYTPAIMADGAGGALITWTDFRNATNFDIYAQRVNSFGTAQ